MTNIPTNPAGSSYTRILSFRGGHHFYECHALAYTGRVAVADNSMRDFKDPGSSDDGLLFLDRNRPCQIRMHDGNLLFTFPVIDAQGKEFGMLEDPAPFLQVVEKFNLKVTADSEVKTYFDLITKLAARLSDS